MTIHLAHIKIIFLILILPNFAYAQQDPSSKTVTLFELSEDVLMKLLHQPDEIQRHPIEINDEIFLSGFIRRGDTLIMDLFGGTRVEANVTRVSKDVTSTTSIIGQIPRDFPGNIIITHQNERVFGVVNLYDEHRVFRIKSDPKTSEHFLAEMNVEEMEVFECGGVLTASHDH